MKNAEWCIKQGYKFSDINVLYTKDNSVYAISIKKNGAYTRLGTIKKTCAIYAFMEWLDQEHVEQILDDAEREYLAAVIKPFRERVKHICKVNYLGVSSSEYQYLFITLSDGSYNIDMPIFKRDTMYKGMKPAKDYTPEELGL